MNASLTLIRQSSRCRTSALVPESTEDASRMGWNGTGFGERAWEARVVSLGFSPLPDETQLPQGSTGSQRSSFGNRPAPHRYMTPDLP